MTDPDPFVAAERIIDPMVVKDAGFVHDAQFVAHALLGAQGWLDGPVLTLKHLAFDSGGYLATPASIDEFVIDMNNAIEEGKKAWLARSLELIRLRQALSSISANLHREDCDEEPACLCHTDIAGAALHAKAAT